MRRITAKLGEPIVVDSETGSLKAGVPDPEHAKTQGRIEHVSRDTILVHILYALRRIPSATMRSCVRESFQELLQFFQRFVPPETQNHVMRMAFFFNEPPGARAPFIFG